MCIKKKLQEYCDWIKIFMYLIGISASIIICVSSIITMPDKINNHEVRISHVEKEMTEMKIDTITKLTSLQDDVRLIKEVLIRGNRR